MQLEFEQTYYIVSPTRLQLLPKDSISVVSINLIYSLFFAI